MDLIEVASNDPPIGSPWRKNGRLVSMPNRRIINRASYRDRELVIRSGFNNWAPMERLRLHLAIALGPRYYDKNGATTEYWRIVSRTGRLRNPEKFFNPDAMTALIVRMRLEGF